MFTGHMVVIFGEEVGRNREEVKRACGVLGVSVPFGSVHCKYLLPLCDIVVP